MQRLEPFRATAGQRLGACPVAGLGEHPGHQDTRTGGAESY
jgi:hypothetical protein